MLGVRVGKAKSTLYESSAECLTFISMSILSGYKIGDLSWWWVVGAGEAVSVVITAGGPSSALCVLFFSTASYVMAPLAPYRLIGPNSI